MKRTKRLLAVISMLLCVAIVAGGCGTAKPEASGAADAGASASAQPAASGELEVALSATEAAQIETLTTIFNRFVDEYNAANGTAHTVKITGSQSKDIINTRMSSKNKPDLMILDSPADVAQYVKDDLLLDLTSYAEAQDWDGTMFEWAYNLSKVNDKVYTLPYGYEGIVIWYDKQVMAELGLKAEEINSLATFESALEKAKSGGYTPIMLGAQDWPWAQEWYLSVFMSYTDRALLKNTLTGKDGAKWTDPAFVKTVELYKSLHDKGYLADGKSYVLTSDDAINAFSNGKCLFKLEGTWAPYWITPLSQEQKDRIGVMLHPAINETEKPHLPIAVGGMWSVSADTDVPELAGYVMGKLLSQDIQSDFLKTGLDIAPMKIDASEFDGLDPVVQEMWGIVNDALASNSYGYTTYAFYPPETRVYVYEGIVNVMEGKISVQEYLTKLQELNDKELAAGFVPILP